MVIHKIISDAPATFKDIKTRYLAEAQQLQAFDLPKREIQDDALRFNLLDLQKDRLISFDRLGRYHIVVDGPDYQQELMDGFRKQRAREDAFNEQRPRILRLIEEDSGKYTSEVLLRKLHDEKVAITDDVFYDIVNALRAEHLVARDESGKLFNTHD